MSTGQCCMLGCLLINLACGLRQVTVWGEHPEQVSNGLVLHHLQSDVSLALLLPNPCHDGLSLCMA